MSAGPEKNGPILQPEAIILHVNSNSIRRRLLDRIINKKINLIFFFIKKPDFIHFFIKNLHMLR
ncbi:hypothetical protein ES705_47869 [subsurface metagenome]